MGRWDKFTLTDGLRAGNDSMRAAGRTEWTLDDWNAANQAFAKHALWPPQSVAWHITRADGGTRQRGWNLWLHGKYHSHYITQKALLKALKEMQDDNDV